MTEILAPCIITARLLPGLSIPSNHDASPPAVLSIEATGRLKRNKPVWRWFVDLPDGEYTDDDFQGWGDHRSMLSALLSFLIADAESARYNRDQPNHETSFPAPVVAWAMQHSDELTMLQLELDEQIEADKGPRA